MGVLEIKDDPGIIMPLHIYCWILNRLRNMQENYSGHMIWIPSKQALQCTCPITSFEEGKDGGGTDWRRQGHHVPAHVWLFHTDGSLYRPWKVWLTTPYIGTRAGIYQTDGQLRSTHRPYPDADYTKSAISTQSYRYLTQQCEVFPIGGKWNFAQWPDL